MWTTRRLVLLFPTHAGVLPLVYVNQLPPSSRASPTTWPQLFEWADADTNRGQILFHKAQAIMRTLFEDRYYSTCGYYLRKYGITVCVRYTHGVSCATSNLWKTIVFKVISSSCVLAGEEKSKKNYS